VAGVACEFVNATFVMVWGSVVSLSFHEVFDRVGAFECYMTYIIQPYAQ
jgi:hypothetical protein